MGRIGRPVAGAAFVAFLAMTAGALAGPGLESEGPADFASSYCVAADETPPEAPTSAVRIFGRSTRDFTLDVLRDQRSIWTRAAHPSRNQWRWLVPLSAAFAGTLALDESVADGVADRKPRGISSKFGALGDPTSLFGAVGAAWLIARTTDNPAAQQTAFAGLRALIATAPVSRGLKIAAGRLRPTSDSGGMSFWKGGRSFPSGHAMNIWALCEVVAWRHRDRPLLRWAMYSLATAISVSRVTGRNHFPSDVVAGSAMGFLIGRFVARNP